MAAPIFALVDCDHFYASCERVFSPRLDTLPVVVLSNNDGCIIARSPEAKALGFAMGDPYHLHRETLTRHGVEVFSSNYVLYGDMSRRVMETLAAQAPEVEIYSVDEAFLNLAGLEWRGVADYARRQHLMASHLMVFVMTNRFSTTRPFYGQSATIRLPYPTDYTPDLIRAAVQLLDRIYRPGFHYQKCGVMLMDLSPAAYHRQDLFDVRDQARQARLMRALDRLNADYGARTVHFGSFGGSRPAWAMRQRFCSPRYTTNWKELPVVR